MGSQMTQQVPAFYAGCYAAVCIGVIKLDGINLIGLGATRGLGGTLPGVPVWVVVVWPWVIHPGAWRLPPVLYFPATRIEAASLWPALLP